MKYYGKLKNFIRKTYGSGTTLSLKIVLFILSITSSTSLLMFFSISSKTFNDSIPKLINQLMVYYFLILLFFSGFFILSLFLYFKPVSKIDKYKKVKILFTFTIVLIMCILFFPYAILIPINIRLGDILKIPKLTKYISFSLLSILLWLILFGGIFGILLSSGWKIRTFLEADYQYIYNLLNLDAITYYSMFTSILIANGISKFVFFKAVKIQDEFEINEVKYQMKLFWNYMILLISFLIKPLEFGNDEVNLFFNALFYSVATITLLSKAIELRHPPKKR